MAIDPVCSMHVTEHEAAGSAEHEGRRYYFCSAHCLDKFRANPAAYIRSPVSAAAPFSQAVHVHTHAHSGGADVHPAASLATPGRTSRDQAKDPICGMVVDKETAFKTERGGGTIRPEKENIMLRKLLQKRHAFVLALGLAAAGTALAAETGLHQVVDGIDVYYGVLPAKVAGKHQPTHEEKTMHGGAPSGKNDYHLLVALFDKSGARITDAQVKATVAELGMAGTLRKLEPMRIEDTVSFGNYFALHGEGPYRITIEAQLPGAARPVEAVFEYRRR